MEESAGQINAIEKMKRNMVATGFIWNANIVRKHLKSKIVYKDCTFFYYLLNSIFISVC